MATAAANTTPVTLHLLSLSISLSESLSFLASLEPQPLTIAKVARWIHPPETLSIDPLVNNKSWDVLLVLPGAAPVPASLKDAIKYSWSITARVSVDIIEGFRERNKASLHPNPSTVPRLSNQPAPESKADDSTPLSLQASPELKAWFTSFSATNGARPVSMLNLLSYASKEKYMGYVKAFGETLTPKYGGTPTIIGEVVQGEGEERVWDDIAVLQYPSIEHFEAMLESEAYGAIDRRWKGGSLRDTGLLCVVEVDAE